MTTNLSKLVLGPIREKVMLIHFELSRTHQQMAEKARESGFLSEEYIVLAQKALELDRELTRLIWELLGLSERTGTRVPFTQLDLPSKL